MASDTRPDMGAPVENFPNGYAPVGEFRFAQTRASRRDIEITAPDGAASLARIGHVLGEAGVGLEGGGMWSGVAHYLVADPDAATRALAAAGLGTARAREVVVAHLDADVPGALGRMMSRLADAGIALARAGTSALR